MIGHRLGIVVPYRDRAQHLLQFVPHLEDYLGRQPVAGTDRVDLVVVEQPRGRPFNRGLMCNIGFAWLRERIDYVCFHDVDYLPIDADYSYPLDPAMILWHGMEVRPIDPDLGTYIENENRDELFSGIIVVRNEHFAAVNGFPNDYWGWGYEDLDLRNRLRAHGIPTTHRPGTFQPLDHRHNGYTSTGLPTIAHRRNVERYQRSTHDPDGWRFNGLNSLAFEVVDRRPLTRPDAAIGAERLLIKL